MSEVSFGVVVIGEVLIWDSILVPVGLAVMGVVWPETGKLFKMLRIEH